MSQKYIFYTNPNKGTKNRSWIKCVHVIDVLIPHPAMNKILFILADKKWITYTKILVTKPKVQVADVIPIDPTVTDLIVAAAIAVIDAVATDVIVAAKIISTHNLPHNNALTVKSPISFTILGKMLTSHNFLRPMFSSPIRTTFPFTARLSCKDLEVNVHFL